VSAGPAPRAAPGRGRAADAPRAATSGGATRRRDPLRHLVTTPLAEPLGLGLVGRDLLLDDLPCDLLVSSVRSGFAFALTIVPSIAITPIVTSPASTHNANTSPNRSASARS
jgi:hypothetical protein